MEEFRTKLGVSEWFRYVDDTFVLIKDSFKIEDLLKALNNKDKNIKFTYEVEKKRKKNSIFRRFN